MVEHGIGFASPCVEGITFDAKRGQGGAPSCVGWVSAAGTAMHHSQGSIRA